MNLAKIHDKIQAFLNKKLKVVTDTLPIHSLPSWEKVKEKAKEIFIKPGWAVYFVREENYIDHVAIAINQEPGLLNLSEAVLLHAAPSPIGHGVGPLTNSSIDKSGLRICTAIEYIELYPYLFYRKVFIGPPPNVDELIINNAGVIAEEIAKTGLIDNRPVVYSFGSVPILKKYFVSFFDTQKFKTKIERTKKLKKAVLPFYCGGLVGEIWRRAGIINIPGVKILKIKNPTSFTLFNWSRKGGSIFTGLSW